jgi:prepilin-type N-terminal cleavage/methylation domain-containing protein
MMNKKGFTLFELLISISIIGILTALAVVSFSSAQRKARDSRRIQDLKAVQAAAEQFYSLNSYVYPADTAPATWKSVLQSFPLDPKLDAGWSGYVYNGGIGSSYCACAAVENYKNGNATDNACSSISLGGTGPYFCIKNQQ